MKQTVRTRFAPSPTGYMHVGGIRTALFAWLIAKQADGRFILRIEDTDQAREVQGSDRHIIECLGWLDLIPDEGPDGFGGKFEPYRQSERLSTYHIWAQRLINAGRAYADPYTTEEVQSFREAAQAAKKPFLFRNHRPDNPPAWDGRRPLRFRSDPQVYQWHDMVMGKLSTGPEVIDDFILMKSDGFPTYNFAHIVDDAEMQVTHIIRGQEFVASMPNYLNLYDALGIDWQKLVFASVPPIMNEQGNKKLSKRDGAKDILAYRNEGYLPEAMRNFLASLGWNDGTEQEVFTTAELISKFSLAKVQRSGARFDEKRLLWLNGAHIRLLPLDDLYRYVSPPDDAAGKHGHTGFWPPAAYGKTVTPEYRRQILKLAQDRLKLFEDLRGFDYFFTEPSKKPELITDNKQLKKLEPSEIEQLIDITHNKLSQLTEVQWTAAGIQTALNELLAETGQKPSVLFSLIRIYATWAPFSPQLDATLALLGKERTLTRLQA